jgi:hypothetical protein
VGFHLEVEPAKAIDAFTHPYAYEARRKIVDCVIVRWRRRSFAAGVVSNTRPCDLFALRHGEPQQGDVL